MTAAIYGVAWLSACGAPPGQATTRSRAGTVQLDVFQDKVVITNHTDRAAANCRIRLADAYEAPLAVLAPGQVTTVMRSRFRPYVEAAVFYADGQQTGRIDCMTAQGPVTIRFQNPVQHTQPAR